MLLILHPETTFLNTTILTINFCFKAFQNLPSLQELDLAYNEMKNFEFATLDQVGTLSSFRLNMSHNTLRKLESNGTVYVTDRMRGGVIHTNIAVSCGPTINTYFYRCDGHFSLDDGRPEIQWCKFGNE